MTNNGTPEFRVLYIASASVTDRLIVSQVLRYLEVLAGEGVGFHLITFERAPIAAAEQDQIRDELRESGVVWHPVLSAGRSRILRSSRDIWNGYRTARRVLREYDIPIVHARSFIPGQIGRILQRQTSARLLYDCRSFWTAQKFLTGAIRSPWLRRRLQRWEDRLYREATVLSVLTQAAARHLAARGVQTPTYVVPTCVDTRIFIPPDERHQSSHSHLVYAGSLGPVYQPDLVFRFFRAFRQQRPDAHLLLLSSASPEQVRELATECGCDAGSVTFETVPPADMPRRLRSAAAGLS
ncbi:MAG TPA: glycosyltransferase, partial [Planctomycetaceae bacterium]|nr:glycosyltransferase [Planctomycetaceae bacterium]